MGQPLPRRLVEAELRLADVAGDDLEVVGGQSPEPAEQLRVAAVEGRLEPRAGGGVVVTAQRR